MLDQNSVGLIASQLGYTLPNRVLRNAQGKYYIGTFSEVHCNISRESQEYWDKAYQAEDALAKGTWTQRRHP